MVLKKEREKKGITPLLLVLSPYLFFTKIATVKNSTRCRTYDWSQRNFKSQYCSDCPCITLQAPFQGHIYGRDVPNILCLQHPGIVAIWIDFKPPYKNKVARQSRLFLLFAAIHLIYTKRINPKLETESECNHIYVSFSMRMLLSDIWSRSNFWVTVHTSWVMMSLKQLIDTHLQTESITYVANVGFIR